eukprot:CAMPEP_0179093564 /NCGR_PEP_ID=MMETSP0796-20121207/42859_1 /TAXON_ID=73915 /ORGANISM="Pyrodinium bahamense, Strain pbaha01" /LENGTH=177 /DNA_ID=CAMNT_0020791207 /DNA_START=562 /DNA_END=1092 /DNA_ORIENTATION=-
MRQAPLRGAALAAQGRLPRRRPRSAALAPHSRQGLSDGGRLPASDDPEQVLLPEGLQRGALSCIQHACDEAAAKASKHFAQMCCWRRSRQGDGGELRRGHDWEDDLRLLQLPPPLVDLFRRHVGLLTPARAPYVTAGHLELCGQRELAAEGRDIDVRSVSRHHLPQVRVRQQHGGDV